MLASFYFLVLGTQEKQTELESESNIFMQKGGKSELALFNGSCPIVEV